MKIIIYTRQGCHLCEEAEHILVEHGLAPRMLDIDTDPSIDDPKREQYDHCVPVVVIDGKIRFRGRVEPRLLQRILSNHDQRNQ